MKKAVLVIAVLLMSLGLKAQVIPTSNIKVRSGNLSLADREKIIAFYNNNISNLNAEVKKINANKEKEVKKIKAEKSKFAVNGKPKLLEIPTGDKLENFGDAKKQKEEIKRITKLNEEAQANYEEELKGYDTKISDIEAKYDKEIYAKTAKIESCDSMKLVVMNKLVNTDSLKYVDGNFNGSAYNTANGTLITTQAVKSLNAKTNSSDNSNATGSENCGSYKGLVQNNSRWQTVTIHIISIKGEKIFRRDYVLKPGEEEEDYLPLGKYITYSTVVNNGFKVDNAPITIEAKEGKIVMISGRRDIVWNSCYN